MSAPKVPTAALCNLPASVKFTLADGTSLTAAVRLSSRARCARLSLSPRGGLVLAVPIAMDPDQLHASLPRFVPWLERAKGNQLRTVPAPQLPARIDLPLTGQSFAVDTAGDMAAGRKAAAANATTATLQLARGARRLLLVESAGQLQLFGNVEDISLCAQGLRQWSRKKATLLLPPLLERMAACDGFALAGVCVRDQRSRWGSCSQVRSGRQPAQSCPQPDCNRGRTLQQISARIRTFFADLPLSIPPLGQKNEDNTGQASPATLRPAGRISLNWRALLLPVDLLEHLCWHELCHLRHMNHSAAYRAELARFSPCWAQQEKALNAAWRSLQWWALPGDDPSP